MSNTNASELEKYISTRGGEVSYPPFSHTLGVLHTHDKCEIYCVFRGRGHYIIEGSRHKLEPGKLILMRPGEAHKVQLSDGEPYDRIAHHFPMSTVDAIDPERRLLAPFFDRPLGLNNVYPRSAVANTKIYDLFPALFTDMGNSYASQLNTTLTLLSILSELKKLFDSKAYITVSEDMQRMHPVVGYVNEHLTGNLSVDQICQNFFLSRSQLYRDFKVATGTSVWDYVMKKRLLLAKIYLTDGMHAHETALACGFRDYSSFYRAFLKQYGVSPSAFQNSLPPHAP